MKRFIVALMMIPILLSACGTSVEENNAENVENNSSKTETVEVASERAYNENMSEEQFSTVTNDFIDLSTELSEVFTQMASLTQKHAAEIENSETFDWSKDAEFLEVKEKVNKTCDKIIDYDDSVCSKEYQLCTDEFKSMAYQLKKYFDTISCEMSTKELNTLTQSLTNDVNTGFSNALVYQLIATAAYMESNGADQERIDNVLAAVKDTNLYKQTMGISTTKTSTEPSSYNTAFTNSYGSPDTKCNHSGCKNAIASSGDTNCCVVHSNKCANCGKYIDEDALFCMDCISGKTTSIKDTGKYNSNSAPKTGCQYQYFDGSVCGKQTNHYASLCDEHFKQLNDTFNAFTGQ